MKKTIPTAAALLALLAASAPAMYSNSKEQRTAAADALQALVAPSTTASSTLAELVAAGETASERLAGSRTSRLLLEATESARWRAIVDEDAARLWLVGEYRERIADLSFQPLRESSLPVGFPAPSPVNEIQLKSFPAYRMARTATKSENGAFWTLFRHIKQNDIAMTAPVEMAYTADERGLRQQGMAFLYGSTELGSVGQEGAVEVTDIEAGLAVSIGRRGARGRLALEEACAALEQWIAERDYLELAGDVRVMGYNSPMVPVSRRYWEVQIPVRFAEDLVW